MTMPLTVENPPSPQASFWDKIALKYANSTLSDQAGYEKTLKRVGSFVWPKAEVPELGCGTGTSALQLATTASRYTATDISPGMIAVAAEKLVKSPTANLGFEVATAETLVREQRQFDVVLGFDYLHLVSDLEETLGSIHALLKPGGLFISKTPCLGNMNPLIRLAIPVMRLFGKAPDTVLTFSMDGLQKAIEKAGFEIETREFHGTKGKDVRPFIVARRV